MSSTTSPLGLVKPVTGDAVTALRTSISSNADTLNTALGQVLGAAIQEGAIDNCYEVTQASGGASTTVDVSSNIGSGVVVQDDSGTGLLYRVAPTVSKTSVTITSAHATLPRVDAVVVSHTGVVSIVAGTATAGATLDNARDGSHGGAGVPSSAMHLADLLVPATDTTISNNQIRDRRKWARGASCLIERNQNASAVSDYPTTSTSRTLIDSTNLYPRIECAGGVVVATLSGNYQASTAGDGALDLWVDGSSAARFRLLGFGTGNSFSTPFTVAWELTLSAGSHRIGPAFSAPAGSTFTVAASAADVLTFSVIERVRQNTANNPTTSG